MKKIIFALAAVVISSAAIIGLCSFINEKETETAICTTLHTHAQGKNCTGTVGCDCSGWSPITNGDEWQKNYCRRCGHHKNYHR